MTLQEQMSRTYRKQCPCCRVMMTNPSMLPAKHLATDRTRAHVHPAGSRRRKDGDWFWGCRKCNQEQAHLSLDEWWLILAYQDDPRRDAVMDVLMEIGGRARVPSDAVKAFILTVDAEARRVLDGVASFQTQTQSPLCQSGASLSPEADGPSVAQSLEQAA